MSEEISVKVASYGEGRCLMMVYKDPVTGKRVAKSSGTTDRREAERAAGVWQDELNSGRYAAPNKTTWQDFRQRYAAEKLATLAPGTQATAGEALDLVQRIVGPDRLAKVTAAVLSKFAAELRKPRIVTRGDEKVTKPGVKQTTVARHLRHIKAALRWAERVGLMHKAPAVEMPKLAKGQSMMRGRPITAEEHERMLAAAPKIRPQDAPAWIRLLTGLWLSGLRISEALVLSWDEEAPFIVDLTGDLPAFRIYSEAQKARRDELLPMTPDFAEFLLTIPEAERAGRVFKLSVTDVKRAGTIISAIGEKAGVVVNKADGKFASAHDLRRAFGTRWSKRVMPATLMKLMRHREIGTTMKFYVSASAAEVAADLWARFGTPADNTRTADNTSDNTAPETAKNREGVKRA